MAPPRSTPSGAGAAVSRVHGMSGGGVQKPAKQNTLQQSSPVTQASPEGVQSPPGGTHTSSVQVLLQQSDGSAQGCPCGAQAGTHVIVAGSQAPPQQSSSTSQAPP